jgi:hypothetical protein
METIIKQDTDQALLEILTDALEMAISTRLIQFFFQQIFPDNESFLSCFTAR